MMVNAYEPTPSRDLALAVAAAALPKTAAPSPQRARVLELGGWDNSTWRHEVSQLVRRRTVVAVALRTEAHERILSDNEWAAVLRQVAGLAGLADKGWVGVRVSPRTVTLLTTTAGGPLPLHDVRAFGRRAAVRAIIAGRAQRIAAAQKAAGNLQNPAAAAAHGVAQLSFVAPPTAAPPATSDPAVTPRSAPPVIDRRPHR